MKTCSARIQGPSQLELAVRMPLALASGALVGSLLHKKGRQSQLLCVTLLGKSHPPSRQSKPCCLRLELLESVSAGGTLSDNNTLSSSLLQSCPLSSRTGLPVSRSVSKAILWSAELTRFECRLGLSSQHALSMAGGSLAYLGQDVKLLAGVLLVRWAWSAVACLYALTELTLRMQVMALSVQTLMVPVQCSTGDIGSEPDKRDIGTALLSSRGVTPIGGERERHNKRVRV